MERDPANVQVVVSSANMSLRGEDDEFLSITELPMMMMKSETFQTKLAMQTPWDKN